MLWLISNKLSLTLLYDVVLRKSINITKSINVNKNVNFWNGRGWSMAAHEKFTVTKKSSEKIFVTITFKNRDFCVLKSPAQMAKLTFIGEV